jgi:large subunit ribosomal protein L24
MNVKKGDKVQVTAGDDKGKKGKVLRVDPDKNRVLVEGINFIKRHTRPNKTNPQGGILEKEAPVHASNLRVVCPGCGEAKGFRRQRDAEGNVRRICRSCGESL